MKALILFFLSLQLLSFNALSDSKFQRNEVTEISEVEDLAPVNNDTLPISYHWTKDTHSANKLRNNSLTTKAATTPPLMTYHNTTTPNWMTDVITTPIFWGKSWGNGNNAYTSDKIIGLNYFYSNINTSTYKGTVKEYGVLSSHSANTSITDTSTASSNVNNVLAEVCKVISGVANTKGYYPVYTDVKRGSATYCAYHSAVVCKGTGKTIQFAFFFDLNDDAGCDPVSSYAPARGSLGSQNPGLIGSNSLAYKTTSFQQSQGLAALANVSAHELMETVTDPAYFPPSGAGYWSGWYDSLGSENGDKCAWTFGPSNTRLSAGTVNIGTFNWKLQSEWSNALPGCITGS